MRGDVKRKREPAHPADAPVLFFNMMIAFRTPPQRPDAPAGHTAMPRRTG